MDDTVTVKRAGRRAVKQPAVDTPTSPEATPAAPQAAPAAPAPRQGRVNLVERRVVAVQFHTGVQVGTVTTTGLHAEQFKKVKNIDVDMRLVGPGVWIKVLGKETVVPFSNILRVDLEGEAAG